MDRSVERGAQWARGSRGGVLVALTALLTAVGHLAGGGSVPDLALLVVLLPLLAWPVVAVAERCRGPVGTAAVLGAGQFGLHLVMVAVHDQHHALHDPAALTGPTMVAVHAAVTAVSVLALRHADRGLAALGAALRRVVPRRIAPPAADRPLAVPVVPGPAVPARIARALAVTHVRRGPPVGC
ncbi:MAG TPA: hypothetical protein VEZ42_08560 [Pseudonocardia sp.]|nr:hypothetical protein [Pseudonocardia sp.]